MIAAGPFTTSDNLTYEPLMELLDFARKKQPNLLLLVWAMLFSSSKVKKSTAMLTSAFRSWNFADGPIC